MKNSTVVIDAQSIFKGALSAFPDGETWTVWYFGNQYENFLQLQRQMPKAWVVANVGLALEHAAERLKHGIADIENTQFPAGADRTWWDASDLGDRGPYVTHLLEGAAQSWVMNDAIRGGGANVFIFESIDFARLIYRGFVKQGVNVGWGKPAGRYDLGDYLHESVAGVLRFMAAGRAVLSGIRYMTRALYATRRGRRSKPIDVTGLKKADVILVVWSGKDVFPAHGLLTRERYFGELPLFLRELGFTVGYLVCTAVGEDRPQQLVDNICRSQDPVISVEDCLSVWKIAQAAVGALIAPWRISLQVVVDNVDMEPVLRYERQREMQTWRPMQSRLLQHVGGTFAEYGIQPSTIIHLYENQPWEKVLRAGIRRSLPGTKVVGYQHVPLAPYFINTYPSTRELAQGLIPDHILVPGEFFKASLYDWGMPAERLSVGGALRFEGVNHKNIQEDRTVASNPSRDRSFLTILCCTSIDFDESFELVYKLSAVLSRIRNLKILVNFHPAFPPSSRERLKEFVSRFSTWNIADLEYSEERVHNLLPQADLVAYNTSSSAYDSLAVKCPVLCVLSDITLDYDRVPRGLSFRMRSIEQLTDFVADFANGNVPSPPFEDLHKAMSPGQISAFEAIVLGSS